MTFVITDRECASIQGSIRPIYSRRSFGYDKVCNLYSKRNDLGLFIRPFANYRVDLLFETPFNLHRSNCYITPYFYILCMTSSILKYVDRYVNTAVHLLPILVMLTLFYELRCDTIQRYSLRFPSYFPFHSSLKIEFSFLKLYQVSERNYLTGKALYINYVYCIQGGW